MISNYAFPAFVLLCIQSNEKISNCETIFNVENELIYVGQKKDLKKKVVFELEEIKDILKQYHSNPMGGHSGINNTLAKISQYYTWNGMKADVAEYVSHTNGHKA